LVSGFAGRDIETEGLQKALDAVKANISKTSKALEDAVKALKKAQSRPGDFAGVGEFPRQVSSKVELRRLQDEKKALKDRLAARAKALEAERASSRVGIGDAATAPAGPTTIADRLKRLTETLATLGKTISESLQPMVDALSEVTPKKVRCCV